MVNVETPLAPFQPLIREWFADRVGEPTEVRRNLLAPLEELRRRFDAAGEPMPDVRVLTRSGDTPAEERARMARRPPEILITTPESLNILLTSRGGRAMLTGLATVILDEVHAV